MKQETDFSIQNWEEYINTHIEEFSFMDMGYDRLKNCTVQIRPNCNNHIFGEGYSQYKEEAREKAIKFLASVLYEFYKTPSNLADKGIEYFTYD